MEFTSELSSFQGSIVSLDSIHGFSKITGRGGNEEKIDAVVKALQSFMKEKKLNIIESDNQIKDKVRKFAFYLVLNADLDILQELVELDAIGSVIWTVPTIPSCLLSEILWQLYMENFIYELIVFTCPQLSLQLADVLIENFKYFHPRKCLKNLEILITACYRFIYRLLFFNIKNIEVTQAVNNFHTCIKFFYEPPNPRKLATLKKDEKYRYVGENFHTYLTVICECFNEYNKTNKFKPPDMHELYALTYLDEWVNKTSEEINVQNCTNKDIKESIDNCNVMLLDVLKELVMEVSVEIYCAWSEFEDDDKSMQQTIGELCYRVHTMLKSIASISEHPVISMLEQISCKPLNSVDVINELDSGTIISNILNNNDEEKTMWIKALLHRDNLCSDLTLVEQAVLNMSEFNSEECCKLFDICKEYLKDNPDIEEIQNTLIKSFQQCSYYDKIKLLEEHFKEGIFNDDLVTKQFNTMMTEIFNKLTVSAESDLTHVLCIFLQSPSLVYNKIFTLASENSQQSLIMIKVMQYLEKFSHYYYSKETEPCIVAVTKRNMQSNFELDRMQNFIDFIKEIKLSNIIPGIKLLLLVIMPNLHLGLVSRNIVCIHMQCKLLIEAYTLDELIEYRVSMLAMLAQVLDAVRWKINTFMNLAPATLELGLQLLKSILDTYPQGIPDNEKSWLKMKLKNINPINMYYYRQLWNPPGDTFLEVVTGVHIFKDMDIEHLTTRLSKVLSSSTLQEWNTIWGDLTIFPRKHVYNIFHEALLVIALAERKFRNPTTWACLMYCFKNFTLITKSQYLGDKMEEGQVINVIQKYILLENFVEEENVESFCNLVLPLFAFIAENQYKCTHIWMQFRDNIKNKSFCDSINIVLVKTDTMPTST